MGQIIVNTPTQTPVKNSNAVPLYNSISTETLANNINIEILVNTIKPNHSKDIEYLKSHNRKKLFFDVDSTTKF